MEGRIRAREHQTSIVFRGAANVTPAGRMENGEERRLVAAEGADKINVFKPGENSSKGPSWRISDRFARFVTIRKK